MRTTSMDDVGSLQDDLMVAATPVSKKRAARRPSGRPSIAAVEVLELGLAFSRRVGARVLDDLQAHLEVWKLRADPSTQLWVDETRRLMAGSFDKAVQNQPTPKELVEQVLRARRT